MPATKLPKRDVDSPDRTVAHRLGVRTNDRGAGELDNLSTAVVEPVRDRPHAAGSPGPSPPWISIHNQNAAQQLERQSVLRHTHLAPAVSWVMVPARRLSLGKQPLG